MTTSAYAENGLAIPLVRPRAASRVSVARRVRSLVAGALLLAVLAAAGLGSLALVRGTWMVTPVLSGSMRPGLAVGGVVVSERVPVDSLAVRDVIVFRRPDQPAEQVVHRIVHIARTGSGQLLINTQGDANAVRDPWTVTLRGSYAYEARWSVPLLGYVAVAFQNYRGFALLGAGFVLVVMAVGMAPIRRRRAAHLKGNGASKSSGDARKGARHAGGLAT